MDIQAGEFVSLDRSGFGYPSSPTGVPGKADVILGVCLANTKRGGVAPVYASRALRTRWFCLDDYYVKCSHEPLGIT